MSGSMRSSETPTTCANGRAGFVSGPMKLKTVGTRSSRLTGVAFAGRRMEHRREHEADAGLGEAPLHATRVEVDLDAERLEHVGRAAVRRGRAVAVFGHRDPRAGHDDRRDRGDVERVAPVAAGAAGVDDRRARVDGTREAERRRGETLQLVDGLALGTERHQEAADLPRGRLAAHDHAHGFGRFLGGERLVSDDPRERVRPEVGVQLSHGSGNVAGRTRRPTLATLVVLPARPEGSRGCGSMAERKLPKLETGVRFPSPAPSVKRDPSDQALRAPSYGTGSGA